jgi:lipopolysaccharide/colanic/teichoic acid biosynthesis glycosyltransferase
MKLRSMRTDGAGTGITVSGDARITKVGAFLRKYKIDELPQLWNVLAGKMQWIGPRPELPSFVSLHDPLWRTILSEKPGLTDLSSLVFRNEEEILAAYPEPAKAYRQEVLPAKLMLSAYYLQKRTFVSDCKLLCLTVKYSFFPSGFNPDRIRTLFGEHSSERNSFYSFPSSLS